jgi:hypothetical protein
MRNAEYSLPRKASLDAQLYNMPYSDTSHSAVISCIPESHQLQILTTHTPDLADIYAVIMLRSDVLLKHQ